MLTAAIRWRVVDRVLGLRAHRRCSRFFPTLVSSALSAALSTPLGFSLSCSQTFCLVKSQSFLQGPSGPRQRGMRPSSGRMSQLRRPSKNLAHQTATAITDPHSGVSLFSKPPPPTKEPGDHAETQKILAATLLAGARRRTVGVARPRPRRFVKPKPHLIVCSRPRTPCTVEKPAERDRASAKRTELRTKRRRKATPNSFAKLDAAPKLQERTTDLLPP